MAVSLLHKKSERLLHNTSVVVSLLLLELVYNAIS